MYEYLIKFSIILTGFQRNRMDVHVLWNSPIPLGVCASMLKYHISSRRVSLGTVLYMYRSFATITQRTFASYLQYIQNTVSKNNDSKAV